jgi:signal transduction histidine kinase
MDVPALPTDARRAADGPATPGAPPARRPGTSRLFRKYFVLILALVTAALLLPSTISYWFSRGETLDALHAVQREKALAAASRIEQYITNVQGQLRGAALPQLGADGMEQRRLEFLKLLKQVPDVTDIAYVGGDGCEKVRVSRLEMDAIGECLRRRAAEPAFTAPTAGKPWYGPVYFRKETEPYMQIAVRSGGDASPVTVADVNLKFMWEVITRIRIGQKGKAYVVDEAGYLIADPDIGLVLRKTDLAGLAHVRRALSGGSEDEVVLTRDAAGVEVLTAHAGIEPLGWKVFVEQPADEVLAPLAASIHRTAFLLVGGLVISALVALVLARGMARPIRTLQEGAELIGGGKLDHAIRVRTGDELEVLADQFNRMTANLRESYAGLERKVDERTRELTNALEQQTAVTEILRVISSSPTDVKPVLDVVAERAAHLCDATYSRVLLIEGDALNPIAGYQDGAPATAAQLADTTNVPRDRTSLTGRAAVERRTIHHADVRPLLDEYPGARANMQRFGLRAVLVVPLMRGGDAYGGIILARTTPGLYRDDQVALVETFARQAAIAIDNVRLFNQTREALEQQTAIAEILRVTSSSPTDVKPVLDVVAERAMTLCDAAQATIMLVEGNVLRCAASHGGTRHLQVGETMALTRGSVAGRATIDGVSFQIDDLATAPEDEFPVARELQRRIGHHTALAVPLRREGHAIGAIQLWRMEVRPFTAEKIALVETFADQAGIAIDNVRLFNETAEALDQQRASGEVLSAISSSIADTKPVFDVILASCQRLFAGHTVGVTMLREDGMLDVTANAGDTYDTLKSMFPAPLDRSTASGLAILGRQVIVFADVENGEMPPRSRDGCLSMGTKSMVFAPMLYEGRVIGTLWVGRPFKGAFSDKQVTLLKTFAEQAVIAIQNARLVNETREALDQQRASGEVLSAISSSIADVGPVFEVILGNCKRLFGARNVGVTLLHDDMLHIDAGVGPGLDHLKRLFPQKLGRNVGSGLAILEKRMLAFPDIDAPDVPPILREGSNALGDRSFLFAPMMLGDRAIGALWLGREFKGAFADKELGLFRTFTEQAVIALQNSRLFNETREALEQQKASGEVLSVISSSVADTRPVFDKILESCERLFAGTRLGVLRVRDGMLEAAALRGSEWEDWKKMWPRPLGRDTASGIAILDRRVVDFPDGGAPGYPAFARDTGRLLGFEALAAAPLIVDGQAIGALWVGRAGKGALSPKQLQLLATFADQAVIAIQNAAMVQEIRDKSRQLEIASQHKSEFLANMSHELRTPLNAIIGFSEVLLERMFGELNAKQDDYLKDIHASGKHLLSLINDILDLSKVEAGRMELEPARFDVPTAIDNAMTLVRERAQRHAIALGVDLADGVGEIVADERKFKQILLNLLTNAVKFTPDGGRVDVAARIVGPLLEVAVRDTGIGIAKEDQEAVFEEFRQVGRHYTNKQEGTGLGLALTRRFVELHGGTLRLASEPGKGSTFTFTLPVAR